MYLLKDMANTTKVSAFPMCRSDELRPCFVTINVFGEPKVFRHTAALGPPSLKDHSPTPITSKVGPTETVNNRAF